MNKEPEKGSKANIVELTQQQLITMASAAVLHLPEAIAIDSSRQQLAAANAILQDFNQENIAGVSPTDAQISDRFASTLGLRKQMEAAIACQAAIDQIFASLI